MQDLQEALNELGYTINGSDVGAYNNTGSDTQTDTDTHADPTSQTTSIWSNNDTPGNPSSVDTNNLELGTRFKVEQSGYITGVKFYKGPTNTGVHIGKLWTNSGQKLTQATFIGETATGWQTVYFSTPVNVTAGNTYVVSYNASNGGYAYDRYYFTKQLTNGILTAPADSSAGANGVYIYASQGDGFPNKTYLKTNYWVDVVFNSDGSTPTPSVTSDVQDPAPDPDLKTTPDIGAAANRTIMTHAIVHGGKQLNTQADAELYAKFDILDKTRFANYVDGGETGSLWKAIKAINPNTKIFIYQLGPQISSEMDSMEALYLNNISRWNNARGHSMGSINGNHSDWLLHAPDGNLHYDEYKKYFLDFGDPDFTAYWLESTKKDIVDTDYVTDGIFADNMPRPPVTNWEVQEYSFDENTRLGAKHNNDIVAGLASMGQLAYYNTGEFRKAEGKAAALALGKSANPPFLILEEGFVAVDFGPNDIQFYPPEDWKRQVDTIAEIKNTRIAVQTMTTDIDGYGSGTDNDGKSVSTWDVIYYGLGSYLMGRQDPNNAYFGNKFSGYNEAVYEDEYDRLNALGRPTGPYTEQNGIYTRIYENGVVVVNPSLNNMSNISLPFSAKRITHDVIKANWSSLPSVNSVSLQSHRAAIFYRQ